MYFLYETMAGNIVKWWKHKILGGYKQFSVLQECATDSEELVCPIRAPSTCSAPPDLLLTGDLNKETKVPSITRNDNTAPDRMLLEEFTCDVSVEGGGKSLQPLQFSFTFYDLDGHQGKITKDDIAGIVYTIYESIGKSVVVPHCGSKTINVRLTVSPDSKSGDSERKNAKKSRLKSRRLFKHDDEEEQSAYGCSKPNPEIEKTPPMKQLINNTTQHETTILNRQSNNYEKSIETSHVMSKDTIDGRLSPCCTNENPEVQRQAKVNEPIEISTAKSICDKFTVNDNDTCCQDCQRSTLNCADGIYNSRPCIRRIGRKLRNRKAQYHHPTTRTRSLSVGNENSYRNNNGEASSGASGKECLNKLRRNDLIDIIRESMEKSRLCFQSNGKPNASPSKYHRHRSYTVSSKIVPTDQHPTVAHANHTHNATKVNWCGYDSLLHAKICSTNNIISSPVLAASRSHNYNAQQNSTTSMPNFNNYNSNDSGNINNNNINNRSSRSRHRHHNEFLVSASPQVQGYTKLMSTQQNSKLNTALLNQLNPQLTHEQKLTRTISDVEKWLADDQIVAATSNVTAANSIFDLTKTIQMNSKDNNLHKDVPECLKTTNTNNSSEKIKENESQTNKYNNASSPSKKIFNKEILLTRKTPKSSQSSSQRNSSNSDSPNGKATTIEMAAPSKKCIADSKENVVEYASIPIVDASQSECEILLRASSDENESSSQIGTTDNASLTTTIHHRYVHIHHHYYHH